MDIEKYACLKNRKARAERFSLLLPQMVIIFIHSFLKLPRFLAEFFYRNPVFFQCIFFFSKSNKYYILLQSGTHAVLRSLALYFGAKCHGIILVTKASRLKTRDQKKERL